VPFWSFSSAGPSALPLLLCGVARKIAFIYYCISEVVFCAKIQGTLKTKAKTSSKREN